MAGQLALVAGVETGGIVHILGGICKELAASSSAINAKMRLPVQRATTAPSFNTPPSGKHVEVFVIDVCERCLAETVAYQFFGVDAAGEQGMYWFCAVCLLSSEFLVFESDSEPEAEAEEPSPLADPHTDPVTVTDSDDSY